MSVGQNDNIFSRVDGRLRYTLKCRKYTPEVIGFTIDRHARNAIDMHLGRLLIFAILFESLCAIRATVAADEGKVYGQVDYETNNNKTDGIYRRSVRITSVSV